MADTPIAKAYVQIIPSATGTKDAIIKEMGGDLEEAGKEGGSIFSKAMGSALKGIGAVAATALSAATAAAAGLVKGTSELAEYGDTIDKMSQKMGLSAEAYQEWDAIMQHSGTSIESLQAGMKTLANAVENGNEAFERLGITEEQIAEMDNEDLFAATITALQNVDNETERTYLAGQLLGRGATELGALLNTSAEDTEAMRQRVHELGGVMSDEAVKSAAAFQDSLQDMQTSMTGLSRSMLANFLPDVTTVMNGVTDLFTGDKDGGLAKIKDGISGILDGIAKRLPEFIKTGLEIIISLASGIADNLDTLIPAVVDAVLLIVDTLLSPDSLRKIGDAALKIGVSIVKGLWDGMVNLTDWLMRKVTGFAQNILKGMKNALGIHSPSKAFKEQVGENIGLGVAEGIDSSADKAIKAADSLAKEVYSRSKDWADKQIKYQQYTLDEQIELWQTIQSQFIAESKQFSDAEEIIFDLRQKKAKEAAEAEAKILSERESTMKSFLSEIEQIQRNVAELEENYQKELASQVQQIFNTYKLFDAIPDRQRVSGEKLIQNLRGQVREIEGFYSSLRELQARGISDALVEEIRAMGPNARDELNALLELSDERLQEYAALYAEKQEAANQAAIDGLASLREETDYQLQENMKSLTGILDETAMQADTWGEDLMRNFIDGIERMRGALTSSVASIADTVRSYLGFSEPELGPLADFHTFAPDMIDLFAEGIRNGRSTIERAIDGTFDLQPQIVDTGYKSLPVADYAAPDWPAYQRAAPQPMQITVPLTINGTRFAQATWSNIQQEDRRRGKGMVV